jgi:hypothetical protein
MADEARSRRDDEAESEMRAAQAFLGAPCTIHRDGVWVVSAPHMTTYVVDLPGGRIMTCGETASVVYEGFYARDLGSAEHFNAKLRWAAWADADYIASKVAETMREAIWHANTDVAFHTINEWEKDRLADLDGEDEAVARLGALKNPAVARDLEIYEEAREHLRNNDIDGARRTINEGIQDAWEYVHTLGRALSPRLFYSRAAMRALCAHLGLPTRDP